MGPVDRLVRRPAGTLVEAPHEAAHASSSIPKMGDEENHRSLLGDQARLDPCRPTGISLIGFEGVGEPVVHLPALAAI